MTILSNFLLAVVIVAAQVPTAQAAGRSAVPPLADGGPSAQSGAMTLLKLHRDEGSSIKRHAPHLAPVRVAERSVSPESAETVSMTVAAQTPEPAMEKQVPNKPLASPATVISAPAEVTRENPIAEPAIPPDTLVATTTLGEIGYANGFRLSNLGGRQEVFIPLPQGSEIGLSELVLVLDDVSAHEARRSLEILVNDRSTSSIALDGKSSGRVVRVSLANVVAKGGFLKLSFVYSGAATLERCIDVRYVGDSLTIRPESAVELLFLKASTLNITATAALLPHNVAILLSGSQLSEADVAAALTLSRSLTAAGRRVTFHRGLEELPELVKQSYSRRWARGLIIVGRIASVEAKLDATDGAIPEGSSLVAAHIDGVPVLLVADAASARDGRVLGNPSLAALRDTSKASVGVVSPPKGPSDRVSFDQLGLVPVQAEVFGRADMSLAIPTSVLPSGTRPSRLVLDVMVAPDGNDQKAVVSAFVGERLLASTVAAIGEATRLDFALPDGLVGTIANIRVVVQRRSAQGDCRFEPQGYPAEILGSSAFILSRAGDVPEDFSDLGALWSNGVEVLVPASTASQPLPVLGMLSDVLNALSRESAPIDVKFIAVGVAPAPGSAFVAVSNVPPVDATQHLKFDRGRVAIVDRAGRTRLDLGGLTTGAVAQIVTSNAHPGLWIKPLTADGSLPVSTGFFLDRGDVAFFDKTGVALAMSTQRDTLLRISYPEKSTWRIYVDRFRAWTVGGLWVLATIIVLIVLQRIYRRRGTGTGGK